MRASKKESTVASSQVRMQPTKYANSKQERKKARKYASKQASTQASKQVRKQWSTQRKQAST